MQKIRSKKNMEKEKSLIKNEHEVYVIKDLDGYFLAKKGTCIMKRITRKEFESYKRFFPEYGVKQK